jgi:hypothetical protein
MGKTIHGNPACIQPNIFSIYDLAHIGKVHQSKEPKSFVRKQHLLVFVHDVCL